MNRCWYDLKLSNKDALKKDFKFPEEPLVQGQWTLKPEQIFNPDWIEYCKLKGIHLLGDVMLFYKAPLLNSYRAHVDVNEHSHTTWALNWCLTEHSGTMYWYNNPAEETQKIYPSKDNRYIEWDTRELELIDQKEIKQHMVICRVDLPHSIKCGKDPRWCISIRAWVGGEEMPDWDYVVDKFKHMELI